MVECAFALQGAIPATPARPADVMVGLGETPTELAGAVVEGPNWVAAGDAFLLSVPTVARYLIVGGREIPSSWSPASSSPTRRSTCSAPRSASCSTSSAGWCCMPARWRWASAAALFAGPSGAGKSTLAAALNRRGYRMCQRRRLRHRLQLRRARGAAGRADAEAVGGHRQPPGDGRAPGPVDPPAADEVLCRAAEHGSGSRPGGGRRLRAARRRPPRSGPASAGWAPADAALLLRRNAYRPSVITKLGLEGDLSRLVVGPAAAGRSVQPDASVRSGRPYRRRSVGWRSTGETSASCRRRRKRIGADNMGASGIQAGEIGVNTTISRIGDWLSAETGDGLVMMSPDGGRVHRPQRDRRPDLGIAGDAAHPGRALRGAGRRVRDLRRGGARRRPGLRSQPLRARCAGGGMTRRNLGAPAGS